MRNIVVVEDLNFRSEPGETLHREGTIEKQR